MAGKLKIYGVPKTRAIRTLWLAEELGLPYELIETSHYIGNNRSAEFLGINPSGRVPAIDDGGFALSESMAINLYLAKKHASSLYPPTLEGEARAWQWSFWVMSDCDKQITEWAMHDHALPAAERKGEIAAARRGELERPLAELDGHLARTPFLLGRQFGIADLNVAATLYRLKWMDLAAKPHLARWYAACWDRPSGRRARALRGD